MAFKGGTFMFSAPICGCQHWDIKWSVPDGTDLKITCKTCGTSLLIPHKEFQVNVVFVRPYPKGVKPVEPQKVDATSTTVDVVEIDIGMFVGL